MTDLIAHGGNGNGTKLPVLPVLLLLATAAVGALTTWALKIDDRLFEIGRDTVSRHEFQQLRTELTGRLDRIDAALAAALAAQRTPVHP